MGKIDADLQEFFFREERCEQKLHICSIGRVPNCSAQLWMMRADVKCPLSPARRIWEKGSHRPGTALDGCLRHKKRERRAASLPSLAGAIVVKVYYPYYPVGACDCFLAGRRADEGREVAGLRASKAASRRVIRLLAISALTIRSEPIISAADTA